MTTTKIKKLLSEYFLIAFALIWTAIIITDYINKHPLYFFSVEYFRYPIISCFVILFTLTLYFLQRSFLPVRRWLFTGIALTGILIVYFTALCLSYSKYVPDLNLEIGNLIQFIGLNFQSIGYLILITFSSYLYSHLFRKFVSLELEFKIALGLIILITHLFLIAAIGFLNVYAVIWVILLPFLINIKMLPGLLKACFVSPFEFAGLNLLGFVSCSLIIFFVCINFSYIQTPFPIGFDSRNFYMNIARQVANSEGLVYGFRPYNWGLLLSTGYILFKTSAVSMALSFYGFILTLIAIYKLCVRGLKISINYTLFGLLIISVTPAITNQLYTELKTDMGLLFFQVVSVSYLLYISKNYSLIEVIRSGSIFKGKDKQVIKSLVLLGLFIGFGLTIKLTNLFLATAIVVSLVWVVTNSYLVLSSTILFSLYIFYLGKIDDLTGLGQYHLGTKSFFISLVGLASIFLIVGISIYKVKITGILKSVILLSVFMLLPLAPWVIKSYNETGSMSPEKLLNGVKPGPDVSPYSIINNYKNQN